MRKKVIYAYIVYLLICMLFTCVQAVKPVSRIQTENYGIAKDDAIKLEKGTKVSSQFMLSKNTLQGISVKFQSESRFQNEVMKAALFDAKTGELLAENKVDLKNEMIQNKDGGSWIFFELPFQSDFEREVNAVFSMEEGEVYVCPSLVLSESKIKDSILAVNGEAVEGNLVMTVRYDMGTASNLPEAIGNGLLWIMVGSLIFFFIFAPERNAKESGSSKKIKFRAENIKKSIYRHRKSLGYLMMIAFLGILLIYVYKFNVEEVIKNKKVKNVFKKSETESFIELDRDSVKLEQIFTCDRDNLSAVIVSMNTGRVSEQSKIRICVEDITTGQMLSDTEYPVKKKETWKVRIPFTETLEKAKEHDIRVVIEPQNLDTAVLKIRKSVSGQAIMSAEYGNVDFLKKVYLIFGMMLLFAASVIYAGCFLWKAKPENLFAVTGLSLGVIVMLVIGLNTVPDETSHIDTAYSISNELMGISKSQKPGYLYKRVEDIDQAAEEKQKLNVYHYERLYRQLFSMAKNKELVECAGRNNLGNANRLYYAPQVIGITLGRIFGFGMMPTMMLGRFLALICYVVMTYFAIKKLPFGKVSLLLIAVLPISLQQAASFSYDGLINAVAFLYLSNCLYLIYGKNAVKISEVAVTAITGSMMATVKGGVYVPLCILPLMALFVRKDWNLKLKRTLEIMTAVLVFAFIRRNLVRTLTRFAAESGTIAGGSANSQIYTFADIVHSPLKFVGMFLNTFYRQGDAYIRNLFGGNLAWRDVNISWAIVIGFLLLILLSCIAREGERKIKAGERVYLGIVSFGSFCCIELSMLLVWTANTLDFITGVQGRYFIPFFPLVLLMIRNSFFRIKRNIDRELVFGEGMLVVLTMLQTVQIVVGR